MREIDMNKLCLLNMEKNSYFLIIFPTFNWTNQIEFSRNHPEPLNFFAAKHVDLALSKKMLVESYNCHLTSKTIFLDLIKISTLLVQTLKQLVRNSVEMKFYLAVLILFLNENSLSHAKVRSDCGLYLPTVVQWIGLNFWFLACGESNTRTGGRIVNGKTTIPNKYPWIAAMFTPNAFMCGGAVISDKNILTAGNKNSLRRKSSIYFWHLFNFLGHCVF